MEFWSRAGSVRREPLSGYFLCIGMALLPWCWSANAATPTQAVPKLAMTSPYALPGGTVTFTVTGTPKAVVQIVVATQPAQIARGAAGTQFFKTGTQTTVSNGVIAAGGSYSATINIPTTAPLGTILYAQASAQLGSGQSLFSNAVPYRVQSAVPSGSRRTLSIAATPDGTHAYVVDKLSGVVTVMDSVHDTKLTDLPVTLAIDNAVPHRPLRVVVDPAGSHAFVSNVTASTIPVIDTATNSVVAQIPVPRGSRGIAFDFSNGVRRVYVANEIQNVIMVFVEAPLGTFTAQASIPLKNTAPGPVLVLPNGKLAVGTRTGNIVEILDPTAAPGATTVAQTVIPGSPHELAWSGSDILIPTFIVVGQDRVPGYNRIMRMDPTSYQLTGYLLDNVGTDYRSIAVRPTTSPGQPLITTNGGGTGTTLIVDGASGNLLANIELTGGYPDATPSDLVIVNNPTTLLPSKLYVLDLFRETVRPIALGSGPPYTEGAEIPLAWTGQVRVPFSSVFSDSDNGEWQYRDVLALGGTATAPNPVTCNSCHMDGASDNSTAHITGGVPIQVPAPWGAVQTAPYFWDGSIPTIQNLVTGAQKLHNHTGVIPPAQSTIQLLAYLGAHSPPPSIYLNQDGSMTSDQIAGQTLFNGPLGCTQCHAPPLFIPPSGSPLTINNGIGTGLAPANVPSLRGAWATAPYLSEGQATTLMDVLTINPSDVHGHAAATLTTTQKQQLVDYLLTL
jgi:YVTN family beta-propeller protein